MAAPNVPDRMNATFSARDQFGQPLPQRFVAAKRTFQLGHFLARKGFIEIGQQNGIANHA
jgi:hypothetical protein